MNALVEAAIIAGSAGLLTKVYDVWVRIRTEGTERVARTDRLEKERLDREHAEDIAVVSNVGAWILMEEHTVERELVDEKRKLVLERARTEGLQQEIQALHQRIAALVTKIAAQAKCLTGHVTDPDESGDI